MDIQIERTLRVLLVEDDADDAELIRTALEQEQRIALEVVEDVPAALAVLRPGPGQPKQAPVDLLLLDLKLPGRSGFELMEEIRADDAFAALPIVVLTGSAAEADAMRAYELKANCLVHKVVDFPQLLSHVRAIADFWFGVAKLPPEGVRPDV